MYFNVVMLCYVICTCICSGSSSDENASSNQKKRKRADQEYIGCRVQKEFEGELYRGTVISCRK